MARSDSPVSPIANLETGLKREVEVVEWEQTSLTQIPRGWSRIRRETAIFLKSIGLGIIVATYQGTFKKDFSEPQKVTIRRSRITSFITSLIHVLPLGIAFYEIILNLRGRFIGEDFDQQAWYQLAAKAHEILIDASLTSVVLSYIRHELTNGNGLPFGAFLGGLQFLSVSYLWSRELWSSVVTSDYARRKRVTFLLLMITCGIIAATAGPSSATLLIPRQTRWKAAPTYVLINGTSQNIWPDRLDPLQIPDYCAYLDPGASDPICPGSDWQAIQNELKQLTDYYGSTFNDDNLQDIQDSDSYYFEIPGYQQTVKNGLINSCTQSRTNLQVCGNVVPSLVTTAAFNDTILWKPQPGFKSFTNLYHSIDQDFYQVYTAIQCVSDTILHAGDLDLVRFPQLAGTEQQYASPPNLISLDSLTRNDVYRASGNISEFRLQWIDLPEADFGTRAVGAVILRPRKFRSGPQEIVTCTFNAGWGTSIAETNEVTLGEVLAIPVNQPSAILQLENDAPREVYGFGGTFTGTFANVSGFTYPQRSLEMPLAWLSYVNPAVNLQSDTNTTAFNAYMTALPDGVGETTIANVILYMLLLGISSQGSDIPWQELPNGPIQCTSCLIVKTNHTYEGFAYHCNGVPVILAITLMTIYCTLAVSHTVYLMTSGLSSDAWDSAAEIFALAMNSSPTQHLKNTCSGIIGLKPFRTRVRIIATSNTAGDKADHLEIVFGEKSEAKVAEVGLQVNEEYGSLPMKLHQD